MIARIWSARTTRAQAPAYADYLSAHVLPQLRALDGYAGATLLQRQDGDAVEVQVMTLWRSIDAIRAFAGADAGAAVVTEQAAGLLTAYDRRARHFAVVLSDGAE